MSKTIKSEKIRKANYDCFAYNVNSCTALKELYCLNEDCAFYKKNKGDSPEKAKLMRYEKIGTIKEFRRLKDLEQKRIEAGR